MRPQAKPRVNTGAQVSIETDERRRRLQERTGLSAPRLIADALRELEVRLELVGGKVPVHPLPSHHTTRSTLSRGPCTFRKRDLITAIKAVVAAGCEVVRAEIEPATGKIVVVAGKLGESGNGGASNPWDEVLADAADKERPA